VPLRAGARPVGAIAAEAAGASFQLEGALGAGVVVADMVGVDARAGAERVRSGELLLTACLPLMDIDRRRASAASRPLDFRFALLAMIFAVGFGSVG